jgi:hypothetical protein
LLTERIAAQALTAMNARRKALYVWLLDAVAVRRVAHPARQI